MTTTKLWGPVKTVERSRSRRKDVPVTVEISKKSERWWNYGWTSRMGGVP